MEILISILPAVLVLLTAYLLLDKLFRNDEKHRRYELNKNNSSIITPIRLRAYERLILVLERTTPSNLIVNVAKPGMTNLDLHTELLASIRQEFSHNLSQQIYISDESWTYVRSAQESLLRLVNTCAAKCNPEESATELAERMIQLYGNSENPPTELAISKLKMEIRQYFQ